MHYAFKSTAMIRLVIMGAHIWFLIVAKILFLYSIMLPQKTFDPLTGETSAAYVLRMQENYLPDWPPEVLDSWLYFGHGLPTLFNTLDLTKLSFTKHIWRKEDIPGEEIVGSNWRFKDEMRSIDHYFVNSGKYWIADYMLEHGTWNTGIIILENRNPERQLKTGYGEVLKQPYHLLEGHNRLTILNRLIELGKAADEHEVWIAQLAES
ncbi:MAG: hypothetical protein JWP57_3770 [Spirosoma sp.]|nr:hypothetical protein [Spirosoma sp.]